MSSITAEAARQIRSHPATCTSRGDYLFDLLCVSNRFLTWVDGEPVDTRGASVEKPPVFNREERLAKIESWVNQNPVARAAGREDIERYAQIASEAEERATDLTLSSWRADYGQYPNALILNLPDNLTPEWAAEVEQFRAFLAENCGWVFTDEFIHRLKTDTLPWA